MRSNSSFKEANDRPLSQGDACSAIAAIGALPCEPGQAGPLAAHHTQSWASFTGFLRRRALRHSRPQREPVAEGAAWRALHQGLVAREADLAATSRDDIEIGGADQQRAELRLAERAKEFREPAMRDVEFQRFLVMPDHLRRHFPFGDFGERRVHGRPFAPRAAIDALAHGGEQLLRPIPQRVLWDRAGPFLAQFSAQRPQQRHKDLGLDPGLVEKRQPVIDHVIVEYIHRGLLPCRDARASSTSPRLRGGRIALAIRVSDYLVCQVALAYWARASRAFALR